VLHFIKKGFVSTAKIAPHTVNVAPTVTSYKMALEKTTTHNKYAHLPTDDNGDDERGGNEVAVGSRGVKGGPPPQFGEGLTGGGPLHEFGRGGGVAPTLDMSKTYGRGGFQQVGSGGGRGFPNFQNFAGSGSGSGSFGDSPDTGSPGAGSYGGGGGFFGGVDDMNQASEDMNSPEQAYSDEELEHFFTPVEIPSNQHRLQCQYTVWFSTRGYGKQSSNFINTLKPVGKFGSVEQFWSLYAHLIRPGELANSPDFHLKRQAYSFHIFKMGVKPIWEDPANKQGGMWQIKLRKPVSSRCWENLVLALLGEQFMVGDEICGIRFSIRIHTDLISVWNRTASDTAVTTRIRDIFRRVINLPPNSPLDYEYRVHAKSLTSHLKN